MDPSDRFDFLEGLDLMGNSAKNHRPSSATSLKRKRTKGSHSGGLKVPQGVSIIPSDPSTSSSNLPIGKELATMKPPTAGPSDRVAGVVTEDVTPQGVSPGDLQISLFPSTDPPLTLLNSSLELTTGPKEQDPTPSLLPSSSLTPPAALEVADLPQEEEDKVGGSESSSTAWLNGIYGSPVKAPSPLLGFLDTQMLPTPRLVTPMVANIPGDSIQAELALKTPTSTFYEGGDHNQVGTSATPVAADASITRSEWTQLESNSDKMGQELIRLDNELKQCHSTIGELRQMIQSSYTYFQNMDNFRSSQLNILQRNLQGLEAKQFLAGAEFAIQFLLNSGRLPPSSVTDPGLQFLLGNIPPPMPEQGTMTELPGSSGVLPGRQP